MPPSAHLLVDRYILVAFMSRGSFARPLVAIGPKRESQTLTENGAGSSLAPAEAAMPGLNDELPPKSEPRPSATS
jgi:hypothetical protein